MATDFLSVLEERGFIHQTTDEAPLRESFAGGRRVTAYVGVDPTSDSCHIGHLLPIMGLIHLQRAGHRPLLLVGGGTGRIGDPSGKTELRRMLTEEDVENNVRSIRDQLSRYLDLAEPGEVETQGAQGIVLNNADWILSLGYVDFLREIGRHFSVNRMLAQESVKLRLDSESGLSFLEFNYSILQAYDFLVLNRRADCTLQLGGSDQWGNIVAGIDLIRRVDSRSAHGVTFPLIMTAGGKKMGKTEKGAVWIDPDKTSPYDYYQYWINTDDADVGRFLRLFTLMPMEQIRELDRYEGADIRKAKEVLALEATALTHGDEEARRAQGAARSLFQGGASGGGGGEGVPTYEVARDTLEAGLSVLALFAEAGLCDSKGAARRMARQGGVYVNGESVAEDRVVTLDDLDDAGEALLRAGKKKHRRLVVS